MYSIKKIDNTYNIYGIGIITNVSHIEDLNGLHIVPIQIRSNKLKFLPKIRVILIAIEMITKILFKALKLKPKIIHCHDNTVLFTSVILKIFTGAKLIYDAHELESDRNGLTKTLGKMTFFTEKILWRYIDSLIVVSPSIEKWYKNNIGEKNSEIILNSPILKKDEVSINDDSYLRDYFNIASSSRIFLYIGILGRGRGIDLIIEAFKKEDITSSLVFLGYGELSDELKELAKKYPNIYVHDAVAHEKVVSVAKSADIGLCLIQNVSLSDYYCLPNKLFEYCFSEIPVLASDFPDIAKVVNEYNLGKCTKLDVENVYNAIKEFECMEVLPKINAKDLYSLSWVAQEEKLIKLYKSMMR
jgi:glycosyltransferase involved in cell wall biosynthesis